MEKTANPEALIADLIEHGSRTWTPESIKSVDIFVLSATTAILDLDKPELSRRIAPPNMPLEQFDRMINREISRRDMWGVVLEEGARATAKIEGGNAPEDARPVMEAIRPKFSFPAGISSETAEVRLDPTIVALYDSAVRTLVANNSGFAYRNDVAKAAGFKERNDGKAYGYLYNTDVADKRILYALGAQAAFNPSNPDAQITVTATTGQTLDQIQATYCPLISKLYEGGRSLEPRDAGLTGFIEARIDARTGFAPRNDNFGVTGPCPVPTNVASSRTVQNSPRR